jgi:hypothetical protein
MYGRHTGNLEVQISDGVLNGKLCRAKMEIKERRGISIL